MSGRSGSIVLKNPKIGVLKKPPKCLAKSDSEIAAGVVAPARPPTAKPQKTGFPASFFEKPAHGPDFSGSGAKRGFFNSIGRELSLASRPKRTLDTWPLTQR